MCHAEPGGSVARHARSSATASRSSRTSPNVAVAFFSRASRVAFVFGSQTCCARYSSTSRGERRHGAAPNRGTIASPQRLHGRQDTAEVPRAPRSGCRIRPERRSLPFSSRHLAAPMIHAREQPEARKIASLEPIQHRRGRQPEQLACREQPLAHAAVSAVPIPSAQPPNMACPVVVSRHRSSRCSAMPRRSQSAGNARACGSSRRSPRRRTR